MLSEETLAARVDGVGGSESACILGASPWRSAFEVWHAKTFRGIDRQDRMRLRFGNFAEDFIRSEYTLETGREILPGVDMMRHPAHPYMLANTDGALDDGTLIELKTVGSHAFRLGWGDGVPLYYQIQVQHYMGVAGAERAELVAMVGAGEKLEIFEIHRDDRFISTRLIPALTEFWARVEAAREALDPMVYAPEIDDSKSTAQTLGRMFSEPDPGSEIELPAEAMDWALRNRVLGETIGELQTERRGITSRLKAAFGNATRGYFPAGLVPGGAAIRKVRAGRNGSRFVLEEPEYG